MKKSMLCKGWLFILFAGLSFVSNGQSVEHKINIVDFKVVKTQGKVSVNWSTDNAVPTNYFEVEKSTNGKDFKTVALVLGADPSIAECDCYGYLDKMNKKETYYRLKHIGPDGEVEFSETKILN